MEGSAVPDVTLDAFYSTEPTGLILRVRANGKS